MAFVDGHAHIYPEKIAEKAGQSISDFYTIPKTGGGPVNHLLESTANSPITHFIVHSVAVKPGNVETINNFIANECKEHPQLIGFGCMHQDYEDMEAEVNRMIDLGLKGVKIHPDIQHVNLDDSRLMKLYEIIEGRLPSVIHTGDYRYDISHPRRLKEVLKSFPNLVVDAAHFGGWSIPELGYDLLGNENCYVDTSSSSFIIGARRMKELINLFGSERVIFGSDYPLFGSQDEAEFIQSIGLSDEIFEKVTWKNAERFTQTKID